MLRCGTDGYRLRLASSRRAFANELRTARPTLSVDAPDAADAARASESKVLDAVREIVFAAVGDSDGMSGADGAELATGNSVGVDGVVSIAGGADGATFTVSS